MKHAIVLLLALAASPALAQSQSSQDKAQRAVNCIGTRVYAQTIDRRQASYDKVMTLYRQRQPLAAHLAAQLLCLTARDLYRQTSDIALNGVGCGVIPPAQRRRYAAAAQGYAATVNAVCGQ